MLIFLIEIIKNRYYKKFIFHLKVKQKCLNVVIVLIDCLPTIIKTCNKKIEMTVFDNYNFYCDKEPNCINITFKNKFQGF